MSRNLNEGRARDGKAEEPLRFGPEREPQGDASKGRRPDWKKTSARKAFRYGRCPSPLYTRKNN